MNVTAADLRMLAQRDSARRADSVLTPTGLRVFVPGQLENPMNATWGWRKRRRWATEWKEKVAVALFAAGYRHGHFDPGAKKRVTFTARVWNCFDDDGLAASLKAVRDALVEYLICHNDAPGWHEFVYAQQIDRTRRGVEIEVALL